ncbi:uncharacterized protein UV8b_01911 [Ustilaginoidea virens]|uniref:C3H1-type domain-containing protein n=1 Tax=Ustilaginoidea virens TaxID=1159556 RepID=A0A8E5HLX2_USTVR|nr:uncharacterized protein UV8b_01911 [Ustilaginoidea virens]QUC17670.1 hypothetical protein UV8b_01911 [Ustilaginoidea virens]
MSEEEKDLLARIGQLAGQINRYKSQQTIALASQPPNQYSRHAYRGRGAYSRGSYRVGRPQSGHRHRTLHLNQAPQASDSNDSSPGPTAGNSCWVSRNDRHRQLINANVYEKETNSRAKAIEETRKKKLQTRKKLEKSRFNDFLRHQANAGNMTANPNSSAARNEIIIEGIRFHVVEGGKKLVKSADDRHSATPKSTLVAGVRFHRTKTGNLIANRIVQDQRRSGICTKTSQPCKTFSTTGSCGKGPYCRYQHDPAKVAVCKDFLKDGKCPNGESCDLSHDVKAERVPDCLHYAKGHCTKPDCPYTHSKAAPSSPVCEAFGFYGYCPEGSDCSARHVFECPDFSNTGVCKTKGCKLLHRERASVLRSKIFQTDVAADDDVSSDEETTGSDDVDSDDVAELIDAESDDSDFENQPDFIRL